MQPQLLKSVLKVTVFSITLGLLFSCVGKKIDPYNDSFYTYESAEKLPSFSFILNLKGTKVELSNEKQAIDDYQSGERAKRIRETKNSPVSDDPQDRMVSLKFKMEEEAHKRLLEKLKAINFCSTSKVIYETDEYTHGRYKIKGYCRTK